LTDQFERLRDGDRFWYQIVFSGSMLAQLESTTLADIIHRNTGIVNLQDNVFVDADIQGAHLPPKPQLLPENGPVDGASASISWLGIPGDVEYEVHVYRYKTGQLFVHQTGVTGGSTTLPPLPDGETFQLWVRAINAAGAGIWNGPSDFQTQADASVPNVPQIISPDDFTSDTSPTISWSSVGSGYMEYEMLIYRIKLGRLFKQDAGMTETSYNLGAMPTGEAYQCFIRAMNSQGNSGWSSPLNFHIDDGDAIPDRPILMMPAGVTQDRTPQIFWTNVGNNATYEFHLYSYRTGQLVVYRPELDRTNFTPTILQRGNSYQIFVRARNENGTSAWSRPMDITIASDLGDEENPAGEETDAGLNPDELQAAIGVSHFPATDNPDESVNIRPADSDHRETVRARSIADTDSQQAVSDRSVGPREAAAETIDAVLADWPDVEWWHSDGSSASGFLAVSRKDAVSADAAEKARQIAAEIGIESADEL
ncbi:MAG: hypothetical protein IID45_07095, partial [Planctomycetes bacterium]|nr:hypothetical protein [Planctomycetota bacterium]